MKTFTQYLSESKKEYAFRILFSAKPAADIKDHIKKTLAGYSVKRVGEIKTKLPAREHPLFTGIENPEIFTCDVVCDYPATADMIRKSITDFAIDKANCSFCGSSTEKASLITNASAPACCRVSKFLTILSLLMPIEVSRK